MHLAAQAELSSTTTLEVKKHLRAIGYAAFQNGISQKMDNVCAAAGWFFTNNGQFRIYFIPQPVALPQGQQVHLPAFSAN